LQAQTTRKQPKKAAPLPAFEPVAELAPAPALDLNQAWLKQAVDIHVLDLRAVTSMTDIFFICHGRNTRQNQAICDEIERRLKEEHGERPLSIEGLTNAEWILMDYGDMVFHIFSEAAREYYDLERLYRDARRLQ
jgi:ribosome-associated protein